MEENTVKKIQKLIIDLTPTEHSIVKIRAAERNISMKTWVMRAISRAILEEDKYK